MTLHNYRLLCAGGELVRDGEPCERCVGSHPWHSVYYGCFRQSRIASVPAAATISINRRRRTWVDNVDRFAALTSFARSRFVAGGLPEEKIEVLPNVVADPGPRNSPPSDSDVVLFVGRLTAVKGVATLARAWESARPRGLRLRVIGAGPLAGAFEGVPGVELTGWLSPEQVRAEMLQARALVFPSEWYEGMPMTLLEAFAAGLPVVGSQIGSVAEIVGRSGAEWLVRPGDVDAWAEAFGRLAAGSGLATASATVRSVFERDHTTAAGLERLVSLYTGARAVSG
jgi:glycosyltransferase involved in cell wall biosynthesis